jgi:hypothetical protein
MTTSNIDATSSIPSPVTASIPLISVEKVSPPATNTTENNATISRKNIFYAYYTTLCPSNYVTGCYKRLKQTKLHQLVDLWKYSFCVSVSTLMLGTLSSPLSMCNKHYKFGDNHSITAPSQHFDFNDMMSTTGITFNTKLAAITTPQPAPSKINDGDNSNSTMFRIVDSIYSVYTTTNAAISIHIPMVITATAEYATATINPSPTLAVSLATATDRLTSTPTALSLTTSIHIHHRINSSITTTLSNTTKRETRSLTDSTAEEYQPPGRRRMKLFTRYITLPRKTNTVTSTITATATTPIVVETTRSTFYYAQIMTKSTSTITMISTSTLIVPTRITRIYIVCH